jgi:leader peptidase (prepilin peptidase)/N-methyltransferase
MGFPAWSIVFGLAFGAVVGSFLNVLIYRLPRGLSIAFPPSHCPHCQHALGVRDLVPMLSFLVQRGRCRYCRAPIPVRYFIVELWNASLWTYLWWWLLVQNFAPYSFVAYGLCMSLLIAIFFIDLYYFIIPDELNAAILFIGIFHALVAANMPTGWEWAGLGVLSWKNALIGAFVNTALLCSIALLGRVLFGKDAMGHGDIKLMRGLGALLLLPASTIALILALVLGIVIGTAWKWVLPRFMQLPGSDQEEESDYTPEPLRSLLTWSLLYLFWLDVLLLFLPRKTQEQVYETVSTGVDEEVVPGAFPFGPSLVLAAMIVLLFGSLFIPTVRSYLDLISGSAG